MTDGYLDVAGAGTIQVVRLDDLNVDLHYQRGVDHSLVARIADKWDIAAAGVIRVGRRSDGTLWIVDGQHRALGARLAGETEILAQIIDGLDRPREADQRLKGNTRRSDTAQERFRAQVAAEDAESLAIVAVLRQFDTQINTTPNMHTGLNTVSAVEVIYRADGGIMLTRVLEVVQGAFDIIGGKQAGVGPLKAIAWFLDRHPSDEYNRNRLMERLRQAGVDDWERKARSHKAAQGGALWVNYYRAMVEIYNYRIPEDKKLPWRLSGMSRGIGGKDPAGGSFAPTVRDASFAAAGGHGGD